MKNKLKRVLNGALALVMCMSTFTAVSYVKPMTADAANGSQEWYNPALRWKNTTNNRERTLIANAVISTETMHCSNKNCPSNRNDGFNDVVTGAGGNQGTYLSQTLGTIYRVPEYTSLEGSWDKQGGSYMSKANGNAVYYGPQYWIEATDDDGNPIKSSLWGNPLPEADIDKALIKARQKYYNEYPKDDLVGGNVFIGYKTTSDRMIAYNQCKSDMGEKIRVVYNNGDVSDVSRDKILETDDDGNYVITGVKEYRIIDKNNNHCAEYSWGYMPYGYLKWTENGSGEQLYSYNNKTYAKRTKSNGDVYYQEYDNRVTLDDGSPNPNYGAYGAVYTGDTYSLNPWLSLIAGAHITPPSDGGKYTGHHFTGSYCNACGVWGTSDNDKINSQINNGMFALNSCHLCYGPEGHCHEDHNNDGDNTNDTHTSRTSLKTEAAKTVEFERTYANGEWNKDSQVHKVLDNTLPICLYCFGTYAQTKDDEYHLHPHNFPKTCNNTQISSSNSISVTKTCLNDISNVVRLNTQKNNNPEELTKARNELKEDLKTKENLNCCITGSLTEDNTTINGGCIIHSHNGLTSNDDGSSVGTHRGCGYQKTDIYTSDVIVQDYVGVVDGKTHYVSFNGKDADGNERVKGDAVDNEDGTETVINGSGTLTATLTWDDGEAPSRLLAGTSSKDYTLTYSLPRDSGGDLSKTIVKHGTATVTLIPGHVSDSAEGDKNYWDNTGSGKNNLSNILIGNLPQNDISTIEYSNVNFDLNAADGIGNYDNYTIVTGAEVTDPGNDKGTITGQFILHGSCPNRGSGTTGTQTHAYQFMYSDTSVDFWKCIYCDAYLPIRTREVQTHIHHYYKYDEIPATCNTKGVIFRRCVCGAMETEDTAINPGNHVGTSHKVDPAPTCENEGYEYDECVGCGAKLNGQQMEKLGHQWSVTGVTNNFGHVPNYVIQTCDRCNKRKTISSNGISEDEIFVEGAVDMSSASHTAHDYEYRYTERECENGTYEIWQCSVCSEIERRLVESGKGHIWIEQGDKRDSTCTVNGYRNYICSNCGSRKLEMLPLDKNVHEHTVRTFSRPESEKCTHSFVEYETCTACNATVNVVQNHDPLGHDYKVLLDTKATCHEMGHHVEQCLRCYEVVQEDTPVQDHNYVPTGTISESQCTVDGLRELACEYCGDLKYESIGMTGHTPGKEATCTEDQVCTVCGAVLEKAKAPSFPMTLLYLTTMQIVDKWTMLIRNRDMISDELTRCPIYLS